MAHDRILVTFDFLGLEIAALLWRNETCTTKLNFLQSSIPSQAHTERRGESRNTACWYHRHYAY